jgi:hypothetical protein
MFRTGSCELLEGLKRIFQTSAPVIVYPSSGTGAWEAAIVNTLSPGDRILMVETGHFATLWRNLAVELGLEVDFLPGDWRHGVDEKIVEKTLKEDRAHAIKAVAVVHNETSTGVTTRVSEIRKAIDRAGHPALLMVDTISSLASIDYRHDEWGVDVSVGAWSWPERRKRKGAPGIDVGKACEILLGLGADPCGQQIGFLPLHPSYESAVWFTGSHPDAGRGGTAERLCPP